MNRSHGDGNKDRVFEKLIVNKFFGAFNEKFSWKILVILMVKF